MGPHRVRSPDARDGRSGAGSAAAIAILLAAAVAWVFGGVVGHGFLSYDDNEYVTSNVAVRSGLTAGGVAWALTSTAAYNWHPLTWISHMLDVQLFGLDPAGHHLTSIVLHLASTLLLTLFLAAATGERWKSAFAGALFAIHPLHVESVAWIAERKDVLSTFFLMLTLLAWRRWAVRPSAPRYAAVTAALACGLMSKPMLVTLPLLLLLLDHWPLGRWGAAGESARPAARAVRLSIEKVPLFLLAAASAAMTLWAQGRGGAVKGFDAVPLASRLANAIVSCARYLGKTLLPVDLAVFYPRPDGGLPGWQVGASLALIAALTAAAIALRLRCPPVFVGWSWFLVALVPVIGLVQVGDQAMADRYTYVPSIGLFVAAAWGAPALLAALRRPRDARTRLRVLAAAASVVVLALAVTARAQAGVWRDTATLFRHAIASTPPNALAERVLADALVLKGDPGEAEQHYEAALAIRPLDAPARSNYGALLYRSGRTRAAVSQLEEAVRLGPGSASALNNLGLALAEVGELEEAEERFGQALAIRPDDAGARANLASTLLRAGHAREAVEQFRAALSRDPGLVSAWRGLASALLLSGDEAGAREAVRTGREHGFVPPPDLVRALARGAGAEARPAAPTQGP